MENYSKEAVKTIGKLYRTTKNTVMQKRYLSIKLHMEGYTNKRVADIVALNEHTIAAYIRAYDTDGIEGLIPKKSTGRPRLLTKEQEQKLRETISDHTPDEVGFGGVKNWTAKIACLWAQKEFGVPYKVSSMLVLFHRLKLSYTRPTYVLAKADPKKQARFKEAFEELKKNC
jgi:transposase